MYYEKLKGAEYNADFFDDGDRTTMYLPGKRLILEMQENGEFSVINVEVIKDGFSTSYRRDGKEGLSDKRNGNGYRSNRNVAESRGGIREGNEDVAEGEDAQRDGENASADDSSKSSDLTEKFSREIGRYDYDTLVAKSDINLVVIDDTVSYQANSQTRKQIVKEALKNAATIGKTNSNGGVSVYVEDIGADVVISNNSLRHGLDRRLQENAAVTLKAREILKNAIRVNELTPKHINASDSYVLIGVAKNISNKPYVVEFVVNKFTNTVESVAVLYSVNTKNESAVRNAPSPTENLLAVTDSKISVSQLLDLSIDNFPDVLSESVLRHYGYESRSDGKIGESALFSREATSALQEQETFLREQLTEVTKEAKRAKKQAEYWKGQTKRTLQPAVRSSDIKRVTSELFSTYSSKADADSVSAALKSLGDFIVQGGDQTAELEWGVLKERAVDIARGIIQNASALE